MFGADQVQRFAGAVSTARFRAFGCKIIFRGQEIKGTCTGLKTKSENGPGGKWYFHDAIVRFPKGPFLNQPPASRETLTVFITGDPAAGQPLRIEDVLNHPTNPEFRLSCMRV